MDTIFSSENQIVEKLRQQSNPKIVFADIDGTLFTPGLKIIQAPFYNIKTTSYLSSHFIPFILVTGRSDWMAIDKTQTKLLGITKPDAIITACGSIIYERQHNGTYARDLVWESQMHYTKVTDTDGQIETWNKLEITQKTTSYLKQQRISFRIGTGNTFEIRLKVNKIPFSLLEEIRKGILSIFPKGIRVIFTEKLLWLNTLEIFSGDILVLPKNAGKENAIKYLLDKYIKQIPNKNIHADMFGDATVDVDMLTLKPKSEYLSFSQYLVNPTPLAYQAITHEMKKNENVHILEGDGPEEIWRVVTGQIVSIKRNVLNVKDENKSSFSPAQNNQARQLIKKIEPLLDRLVDKNLSPNEVSFLGLRKLSEGLKDIYRPTSTPIHKVSGMYKYGFGQLTDVLDGVRARSHPDKKEKNGQLIDGFSDRAKEFMQLYIRAEMRMENNKQEEGLQTFLAAFSCALPSIARAQVEITGIAVPERDEKGGSMIDRTKNLFNSLLMDIIGAHNKSVAIDQKIYSTNVATFYHRLSYTKVPIAKILSEWIPDQGQDDKSRFKSEAIERWLEYIEVLQQGNSTIENYLSSNPSLLKEYKKESEKLGKEYLQLPIAHLRKKWRIPDYKLSIGDYLS